MTNELSGATMHLVLDSVKHLSGKQYETLLQKAGLERYSVVLPPEDTSVAGTDDELSTLFAALYDILGENSFRRFQANAGISTAEGVLKTEWGKNLKAEGAKIAEEQKLSWFVQQLAQMHSQMWTRLLINEEPEGWFLTLTNCPTCSHIHDVKSPICMDAANFFVTLGKAVFHRSLTVTEVECAATGALFCKFALAKDASLLSWKWFKKLGLPNF